MNDDQIKKDAITNIKRIAALNGYGEIIDREAEGILRRVVGDLEEMYITAIDLPIIIR